MAGESDCGTSFHVSISAVSLRGFLTGVLLSIVSLTGVLSVFCFVLSFSFFFGFCWI